MAAAAAALGRPHRLEGVVVRGDQRGRELGFPTANLLSDRYAAVPADGVYAAWLVAPRATRAALAAAVSIGTNPTFSGRERRVEAYVLDFDGDLYGERLAWTSWPTCANSAVRRDRAAGRPDRRGRRRTPAGASLTVSRPVTGR